MKVASRATALTIATERPIEDKRMEPERSRNFQRLIPERSASLTARH